MKRIVYLLLGCLLLAGCQPLDEEAVKAPVVGYLSAISEGDLEKAAQFESKDVTGDESLVENTDSFEEELKEMNFGEAFDAQAQEFLKKETALAVDTYEIESVSGRGSSATVTAGIQGIAVSEIDPVTLMTDVQDELKNDFAKYGQEHPDETDQNKIYGDLGKLIFDRMYERISSEQPTDKVLIFQVEKAEDSEDWKITSIKEDE